MKQQNKKINKLLFTVLHVCRFVVKRKNKCENSSKLFVILDITEYSFLYIITY